MASKTASYGVFCRRWGVPLIDGGTVCLPLIIGQGRALDMILTGLPVAAEEYWAIGLVNRVVTAGAALAAAQSIAAEIAHFPALCMRTDRMSAYQQWDFELPDAPRNEGRERVKPLRAEAGKGAK